MFFTQVLQPATAQIVIMMTHAVHGQSFFGAQFHCICSDIGADQCL